MNRHEEKRHTGGEGTYILALDVGGTSTRAILFNRRGEVAGRTSEISATHAPEEGAMEHDPEDVWRSAVKVIHKTLADLPGGGKEIAALGISVQRATFCLWERTNGTVRTPFISWSDVRGADTAHRMNRMWLWKILQFFARIGSIFTGSTFLTAASQLVFVTDHALPRLLWLFERDPDLKQDSKEGKILFGTIETYLIYRFTGGRVHATDASNAAATSLYNPFSLKWNKIFCRFFKIPMGMLPEVKNTADDFGWTESSLFGGIALPIRGVVGDQMSALFGHCCFNAGEVKISQGSGSFVDVNVGPKGKGSKRGLFPLVAWCIEGKPTYMLEGSVATAGRLIDWVGSGLGLSDTPAVLNEFAADCEDTAGVVFVPTPAGIRFPFFNPKAKGAILGLSLSVHRSHVARAVLEGIAHRLVDILDGIRKDTRMSIVRIKVDGGVSRSDVLLQAIADFSGYTVERSREVDMTALGAAFFAGIGCGLWKSMEELRSMDRNYEVFAPRRGPQYRRRKLEEWHKAVDTVLRLHK
ncbi:MAG: FGGY family carbohydrate kinase [Spirochaetia bacterium]